MIKRLILLLVFLWGVLIFPPQAMAAEDNLNAQNLDDRLGGCLSGGALDDTVILGRQGLPSLKRRVGSEPNNACLWLAKADAEIFLSPEDAAESFSTVISISSSSKILGAAHRGLCYLKRVARQYDAAIVECNRAIELVPESIIFLEDRAEVLARANRKVDALADWNRILEIFETRQFSYKLIMRHAMFLAKFGEHELAIEALAPAIDFLADPAAEVSGSYVPLATAYLVRANAKSAMGQMEPALKDYERAVSAYDQAMTKFSESTLEDIAGGQEVRLRNQVSELLSMRSLRNDTQLRKVRLLREARLYDRAHSELTMLFEAKATSLELYFYEQERPDQLAPPIDKNAYLERAWTYFKSGNLEKAMAAAEKQLALKDFDRYGEVNFVRGYVLESNGELDPARQAYAESLRLAEFPTPSTGQRKPYVSVLEIQEALDRVTASLAND